MKKRSGRLLTLAGAILFILGCIAGGENCDGIHGMEGNIGGNGTAETVEDFDAGSAPPGVTGQKASAQKSCRGRS